MVGRLLILVVVIFAWEYKTNPAKAYYDLKIIGLSVVVFLFLMLIVVVFTKHPNDASDDSVTKRKKHWRSLSPSLIVSLLLLNINASKETLLLISKLNFCYSYDSKLRYYCFKLMKDFVDFW